MNGFGGNGDGGKTAAGGTAFRFLVPPSPVGQRGYTRVTTVDYTSGATAHTLTFLRPLGRTKVASAGGTGQAVVSLAANPGTTAGFGGISNAIAANDHVAVRTASDGITRLYTVSSVDGLAVTMTGNLTVAVAAGDDVWFFGVTGDTDGRTGSAHPALLPPTGATKVFSDQVGGVVATVGKDEPILFNSSNGTNAGTLNAIAWSYTLH